MEFFSIHGKYMGIYEFYNMRNISMLGFGKTRGKGFAYWLHG